MQGKKGFQKGDHHKTEFKKGYDPWNKNKPNPSAKNNPQIFKGGENHPNWKGGISEKPNYGLEFNRILKEQIRRRDGYRCQECFRHQLNRKFHIHHIDFNKQNNNPENLISLCANCHMQTNYGREDWIEYFSKAGIGTVRSQ